MTDTPTTRALEQVVKLAHYPSGARRDDLVKIMAQISICARAALALPPSTGSARAEEWRPESPREIYDRALASWNEICPGKENEAMRRGYIAGFSNALPSPLSKSSRS